jgi:hypothetical protein
MKYTTEQVKMLLKEQRNLCAEAFNKTEMPLINGTTVIRNAPEPVLVLSGVSGMLPLTENAKKKLEYINGSCIARDFPKEQPTKEWAGAVLDLLEELEWHYH